MKTVSTETPRHPISRKTSMLQEIAGLQSTSQTRRISVQLQASKVKSLTKDAVVKIEEV